MATKKGNTISTKAAETKAEPKQVTVSSILNAEAEKKTTAKATTEKKVVATEAKKVTETKKTTAEAKKAPAKKAEETKAFYVICPCKHGKMTSFFCRKEITPPGRKFGDRLPDEVIIHALRPAGPL